MFDFLKFMFRLILNIYGRNSPKVIGPGIKCDQFKVVSDNFEIL